MGSLHLRDSNTRAGIGPGLLEIVGVAAQTEAGTGGARDGQRGRKSQRKRRRRDGEISHVVRGRPHLTVDVKFLFPSMTPLVNNFHGHHAHEKPRGSIDRAGAVNRIAGNTFQVSVGLRCTSQMHKASQRCYFVSSSRYI
jgi:hypothetical protein